LRREAEAGAVIHDRILAMQETNQKVALGAVERKCLSCGKAWIGPAHCGQGDCRGIEFEERDVRPTIIELRGSGLTAVVEPPKPRALADENDLDALRGLRAALTETAERLVSADAAARRLVNVNASNFEVFSRIQEILNLVAADEGFEYRLRAPLHAVGLRGPIRALVAEIDRSITNYGEAAKK
jgi:hypothetical protein